MVLEYDAVSDISEEYASSVCNAFLDPEDKGSRYLLDYTALYPRRKYSIAVCWPTKVKFNIGQ
jgi:hypothetical protein